MKEKKQAVKEDFSVEVKEIPKPVVKEFVFSLNTVEANEAQFISPQINGELVAMIIESNKIVEVDIGLQAYPTIKIFSTREFSGSHYIPIRISPLDEKGDRFNFAPQCWFLNDMLRFVIRGQKNTEVRFVIRYI